MTDDERETIERLALDALKAIHAGGGMLLSRDETIAFLENPPHLLNGVERLPAGKRGPRSKYTRYDARFLDVPEPHRFMGWRILRKHCVAVPKSRKERGKNLLNLVNRFAIDEVTSKPNAPSRTLARRVYVAMELANQTRHIDTIREALQRLGYLKTKNHPG